MYQRQSPSLIEDKSESVVTYTSYYVCAIEAQPKKHDDLTVLIVLVRKSYEDCKARKLTVSIHEEHT